MNKEQLRAAQSPLKQQYKDTPASAIITLQATGELGEGQACRVGTSKALVEAGLHPATGGTGLQACSGDMLLESLVACAGVTLGAVATMLDISVSSGSVRAEGDLDFRGTLGVDKEAPVGLIAIRLTFELDCDANDEQLATLLKLTERYCVVLQTLRGTPDLSASIHRSGQTQFA